MEFEFSQTQTNLRADWIDSDAVVHVNFIHWIQLHVTKTGKTEQGTKTGNGKMKSGNKLRELKMKLLTLFQVLILPFSVLVSRSPFPILVTFNSVRLMWSGASESGLIMQLEQQDNSARASCLAFCCISFTSTARPMSTFLLNVTVLWRTWILDVELSFLFWSWI